MRRSLALLFAVVLLLAACGDSDDDTTTTTTPADTTTTAPPGTVPAETVPETTAPPETAAAPETTAAPDTTAAPIEETEPETDGEADGGGVIGTWLADPGSIAAMYEEGTAGANPFEVIGVSGDVLMIFEADGSGAVVWNEVTVVLNDETTPDFTINGAGDFGWVGTDAGIVAEGWSFEFGVTTSALPGVEPLTISDADLPGGSGILDVTVTGDTLVVASVDGSNGRVFFPALWTRVPG